MSNTPEPTMHPCHMGPPRTFPVLAELPPHTPATVCVRFAGCEVHLTVSSLGPVDPALGSSPSFTAPNTAWRPKPQKAAQLRCCELKSAIENIFKLSDCFTRAENTSVNLVLQLAGISLGCYVDVSLKHKYLGLLFFIYFSFFSQNSLSLLLQFSELHI